MPLREPMQSTHTAPRAGWSPYLDQFARIALPQYLDPSDSPGWHSEHPDRLSGCSTLSPICSWKGRANRLRAPTETLRSSQLPGRLARVGRVKGVKKIAETIRTDQDMMRSL